MRLMASSGAEVRGNLQISPGAPIIRAAFVTICPHYRVKTFETLAPVAKPECAADYWRMGRGKAWLDTGTYESVVQASDFIETIKVRQGLKIGRPEKIALKKGLIDWAQFRKLAEELSKTDNGRHLFAVLDS
jgi:hypothetical protein